MAITQAMATSFKVELLQGVHNFTTGTGHAFKIALYTSAAALDANTAAYTTSGEATGTGYTASGNTLVIPGSIPTSSGTTAWVDFNDSAWSAATITARGAMIYNSTQANKCVCVLDFGADFASTAGTFTVVFPAPAAATAIIRLA